MNDSAPINNVQLKAGSGNGVLYTPKVDSVVMVSFLSPNKAFVSLFSEIETYSLKNDQQSFIKLIEELSVAIQNLTVITPDGESTPPVNINDFITNLDNWKKLFE